jgi:hypothetical protein
MLPARLVGRLLCAPEGPQSAAFDQPHLHALFFHVSPHVIGEPGRGTRSEKGMHMETFVILVLIAILLKR